MKPYHEIKEAMRYLDRYKGETFTVKIGGNVAGEELYPLADDVGDLYKFGINMVLVHGGGLQADKLSEQLGYKIHKFDGERVTDANALEVAKMVYRGKINLEICAALRKQGLKPVGLSGVDGNILTARKREPRAVTNKRTGKTETIDFGYVGEIESIDPALLLALIREGYVPVISCIGGDNEGGVYNINADPLASEIAVAVKSSKFVNMTDVDGILADPTNPDSIIPYITVEEVETLIENNTINRGMIPKVRACINAVKGGVKRATILNGTKEHALFIEVLTPKGTGTLILTREEMEKYKKGTES